MTFNVSKEDKNKFGIYKILDTEKNKYYLGSTNDFHYRYKNHKYFLSKQKHCNPHLQNIYNCRSEKIIFVIVEILTDITQLLIKEQEFLDKIVGIDPLCVNITKKAGSSSLFSFFI